MLVLRPCTRSGAASDRRGWGGAPHPGDDLVEATLAHLESVQRSWIALFNKRCTGRRGRVAMWGGPKTPAWQVEARQRFRCGLTLP